MFKKVKILLLFLVGISFAELETGDTLSYFVNKFRLIMERDTTPQKGIVRSKGALYYLVSGGKMAITSLAPRKLQTRDSIIAGAFSPEGEPSLMYLWLGSVNGETWAQVIGALEDRDFTSDGKNDLFIYDIETNPSSSISASTVYLATNDGIFGGYGFFTGYGSVDFLIDSISGEWAFVDTPIYTIAAHPDSFGPQPQYEIMFVGSVDGVYRLKVKKISNKLQIVSKEKMGTVFNKEVYAVAVNPSNAKQIFAGGEEGLFIWDTLSSDWTLIDSTFIPKKIQFLSTGEIVISTPNGIYFSNDGGVNWQENLAGKDVRGVEVWNSNYYAALFGEGVYKSSSLSGTWSDFSLGLEVLEKVGSRDVYTIYLHASNNILYIGTGQGVYKYDTLAQKWSNISKGLGPFTPDIYIQQIEQQIKPDSLFQSIQQAMQILDNELWDIDYDPHYYIILTKIVVSGALTDPSISPIYGYFDPYDEDPTLPASNGFESFIVNISEFIDQQGNLKTEQLRNFLAYTFAKFAYWSIEHTEYGAVNTGLSILGAYLGGIKSLRYGLTPGKYYTGDKTALNTSLLSFTAQWVNSPVSREMDRERTFLWFEYLRERFGNEIYYEMLRDKYADGDSLFRKVLRKRNEDFYQVMEDWFLANLLDLDTGAYGYPELDSIMPVSPDSFASLIPKETPGEGQPLSPLAVSYFYAKNSDTLSPDSISLSFDAVDNFGTENYGLRVYKIEIINSTPTISRLPLDTFLLSTVHPLFKDTIATNRIQIKEILQPGELVWFVFVNTSVASDVSYQISQDTVPPPFSGSYIIQNPLLENQLDFYVVTKEEIYKDVSLSSPEVLIVPFDEAKAKKMVTLSKLVAGDSLVIYSGSTLLDTMIGKILVYSYAQDPVGNSVTLIFDSLEIQVLQTGTYSFMDGKILFDVPEGAFPEPVKCVVSLIQPELYFGSEDKNGIGPLFNIGSAKRILYKDGTLILKDDSFKNLKEKVSLYHYNGSDWKECPTLIDSETGTLYARINTLGIFQVRTGGNPISIPRVYSVQFIERNIVKQYEKISLKYALPHASRVSIKVYDVAGREIFQKEIPKSLPGYYEFQWNLKTRDSKNVPTGIYFLDFKAESPLKSFNKKMKFIVF